MINCMFGAYAIGDISEIKERLEGYLEIKGAYYPVKENTEKYRGLYQVQKQLLKQNMGPVFDLLEKSVCRTHYRKISYCGRIGMSK